VAWFTVMACVFSAKPMPFLHFLVDVFFYFLIFLPVFIYFPFLPAVKNCNISLPLFYWHREPPANGGTGA